MADTLQQNQMDIDDPPRPPTRADAEAEAGHPLPPTPFDNCVFCAPLPSTEPLRQALVSALDLFSERPPSSLVNSPAFQNILSRCQKDLGATVAIIAVLDGDMSRHLATAGLDGVGDLRRCDTYCAHTVLNGDRGFVILDTTRDWRFVNNPCTIALGARFYAGLSSLLALDPALA